jgi:hypothetical protein
MLSKKWKRNDRKRMEKPIKMRRKTKNKEKGLTK